MSYTDEYKQEVLRYYGEHGFCNTLKHYKITKGTLSRWLSPEKYKKLDQKHHSSEIYKQKARKKAKERRDNRTKDECVAERQYMKKWRNANREKKYAADRKWAKNNKEKIKEYRQDYNRRDEVIKKRRKEEYELYHNDPVYKAKKKKFHHDHYLRTREHKRKYRQDYYLLSKGGNQAWRFTKDYMDWRDKVFDRDSYTCQYCFKSGCKLNAHHIEPGSINESLRYDVNNGLTLCEQCHHRVHSK